MPEYSVEEMARFARGSTPTRGEKKAEAEVQLPAFTAIDWASLEGKEPPPREWIIPHWMPANHITLLSGRGGVGKTLLAQHIGAALAIGHEYLEPLGPRRVLMLAAEDDEPELWRRQIQISAWMRRSISELAENFKLYSLVGQDITLVAPVYGTLTATPMLARLREMVADFGAEVVILDNIARLYGCSENDRHAVTTFCALVQGACAPAAVLLLGHPAKSPGSEYSGSTAWEGAVRARLYLSDKHPDQQAEGADEDPVDEAVRYLSRRKANYSARDVRKLDLLDGVFAPESAQVASILARKPIGDMAKDTVRRAVTKLAASDVYGTGSNASQLNLAKLARQYKLLENLSEREFANAMRQMILDRELVSHEIGKYANRTPRMGLVLVDPKSSTD